MKTLERIPSKFNESPGDFLSRVSEPKYREGDVYIPGTAVGSGGDLCWG